MQASGSLVDWAGLGGGGGDVFAGSEPRVPIHSHAPEFPAGRHHISVKKLLSSALPFLSRLYLSSEAVSIRYSYMCAFCGDSSAKPSTETLSFILWFPPRTQEPRLTGTPALRVGARRYACLPAPSPCLNEICGTACS